MVGRMQVMLVYFVVSLNLALLDGDKLETEQWWLMWFRDGNWHFCALSLEKRKKAKTCAQPSWTSLLPCSKKKKMVLTVNCSSCTGKSLMGSERRFFGNHIPCTIWDCGNPPLCTLKKIAKISLNKMLMKRPVQRQMKLQEWSVHVGVTNVFWNLKPVG